MVVPLLHLRGPAEGVPPGARRVASDELVHVRDGAGHVVRAEDHGRDRSCRSTGGARTLAPGGAVAVLADAARPRRLREHADRAAVLRPSAQARRGLERQPRVRVWAPSEPRVVQERRDAPVAVSNARSTTACFSSGTSCRHTSGSFIGANSHGDAVEARGTAWPRASALCVQRVRSRVGHFLTDKRLKSATQDVTVDLIQNSSRSMD